MRRLFSFTPLLRNFTLWNRAFPLAYARVQQWTYDGSRKEALLFDLPQRDEHSSVGIKSVKCFHIRLLQLPSRVCLIGINFENDTHNLCLIISRGGGVLPL